MKRSLAVAITSISLAGCADLVRINPFDPDSHITIEIQANRDTLTALYQRVLLTASYTPSSSTAIVWAGDGALDPIEFSPSGPTMEAAWTNVQASTGQVRAIVGLHEATHTVALSQRFGGIVFSGCPVICMVFTDQNSQVDVAYDRVDSGRSPLAKVHATTPSLLAISGAVESRSPGVIQLIARSDSAAAVTAAPGGIRGSSWLVYTANHVKDSLLAYADLRPASIQLQCPATVRIGQRQALAATLFGADGNSILAPVPIRFTVAPTGRAIIVGDGQIQGAAVGSVTVTGTDRLVGVSTTCTVQVAP